MRMYKKALIVTIILSLAMPTLGLKAQIKSPKQLVAEAKVSINWVTPQQAAKMMKTIPNLIVIDVRQGGEYQLGHIPGAINIPRGLLEFRITHVTKDPNRPILVYCLTGGRATLAVKALEKMGYKKIYNLKGGFKAWKKAGLPVSRKPCDMAG